MAARMMRKTSSKSALVAKAAAAAASPRMGSAASGGATPKEGAPPPAVTGHTEAGAWCAEPQRWREQKLSGFHAWARILKSQCPTIFTAYSHYRDDF